MSLEKKLAENMIRFGVKNLSWRDKVILSEQDGIEVGSKSGTVTVGKKAASGGVDTEADSSNYDIPFAEKDGAWWVAHLAKNESIPYEGYNITPSIPLMEKLMDPVSLQNWNKLKQDPKHVKQGVAAIAYFAKTNAQMKWTNIFVGNEEFVQRMKTEGGATDWQQDIVVPLSLPMTSLDDIFEDNSAQLKPGFEDAVATFIQNIKDAAVKSKVQNPEFYLLQMSVTTSSSRFRNTGAAENTTWAQLSQERATAAQNYIVRAFSQAGIVVGKSPNGKYETKYVINPKGENGDGTSGPNPPSPYVFNTDGRGTWDCSTTRNGQLQAPNVCTPKDRNKFGQPLPDKAQYEQFKYLACTCDLVMKNVFTPAPGDKTTPPTTQEIPGNVYTIEFYRKKKGVDVPYWYPTISANFRLPELNLDDTWNRFINKVTPGAKAPARSIDCFFKD
jgi:hypothetical protein